MHQIHSSEYKLLEVDGDEGKFLDLLMLLHGELDTRDEEEVMRTIHKRKGLFRKR